MATEQFTETFKKNIDYSIKAFQETTSKMVEAQTRQFELVNSLLEKSLDNSLSIWSKMLESMNPKKTTKTNDQTDFRKNGSAPERKNSVVKQTTEN